jgi:hypothetical protein
MDIDLKPKKNPISDNSRNINFKGTVQLSIFLKRINIEAFGVTANDDMA